MIVDDSTQITIFQACWVSFSTAETMSLGHWNFASFSAVEHQARQTGKERNGGGNIIIIIIIITTIWYTNDIRSSARSGIASFHLAAFQSPSHPFPPRRLQYMGNLWSHLHLSRITSFLHKIAPPKLFLV